MVTGAGRGIGRRPERNAAVAAAARELGPLKVWVNNAGVLRTRRAWEHDADEERLLVEVNLLGLIAGSRTAVEAMRHGGGDLINVASLSSLTAAPGLAVYAATKHAVLGYTTSLPATFPGASTGTLRLMGRWAARRRRRFLAASLKIRRRFKIRSRVSGFSEDPPP